MKKIYTTIGLLSLVTFGLLGCGNKTPEPTPTPTPCTHVDKNPKDFICDLCGEKLPEPTELAITSHPKDVEVTLPEGCSYSVEVNNEKLVKSYMWQVYNGDIPDEGKGPFGPITSLAETKEQWLDLDDCSSGRTSTYIKTSTINKHSSKVKYRCKITDVNDNVIYSNEAKLTYTNPSFNTAIVQVSSYVLLEGQSLDLSTTELGTGVITYVSRTELKLSNVRYHNELTISDNIESETDGILVRDETFAETDFKVTLEGHNVIHNTYWDPDYKAGGIGLNFFFGQNDAFVKTTIEGSGDLAITGGSEAIYCKGTLCLVDTELILNAIGSNYGNGIFGYKVILDGSKISGRVNGPVIHNVNLTGSCIEIKNGSSVDVVIRPQHPSVGGSIAKGLVADESLTITESNINIDMFVCGKDFDEDHPLEGSELLGSGGLTFQIMKSNVNLSYRSDQDLLGLSTEVYGIMGDCHIHYSNISVSINSKETIRACGIAGDDFAAAYSTINVECRASGIVYGLMNNEFAQFLYSKFNIVTESYDGGYSLGLMWVKNLIYDSRFVIDTIDGIAYACLARTSTEDLPFDPAYEVKHMDASKVKVFNFADQNINRYSIRFNATGKYNVVETIYSLSDTTHPASYLMMDIFK